MSIGRVPETDAAAEVFGQLPVVHQTGVVELDDIHADFDHIGDQVHDLPAVVPDIMHTAGVGGLYQAGIARFVELPGRFLIFICRPVCRPRRPRS